jgi:hypothetical protein
MHVGSPLLTLTHPDRAAPVNNEHL